VKGSLRHLLSSVTCSPYPTFNSLPAMIEDLHEPEGIVRPLIKHYEGLKVCPEHFGVRRFMISLADNFCRMEMKVKMVRTRERCLRK
jgi:hypothetical protein